MVCDDFQQVTINMRNLEALARAHAEQNQREPIIHVSSTLMRTGGIVEKHAMIVVQFLVIYVESQWLIELDSVRDNHSTTEKDIASGVNKEETGS